MAGVLLSCGKDQLTCRENKMPLFFDKIKG